MTRQRNDNHSTEFGLWLRRQKDINSSRYDAQNLDFVWFAYRSGWILLLEEKRYNSKQSFSQKDTHNIIHQMLELASGRIFDTVKGRRRISYKGYFLIQFEKTNPDDSSWIKINSESHTKEDLLFLLQYGCLVNLEKLKQANIDTKKLPLPIIISEWKRLKSVV